jgi:hypothetical protein
MARKKTKGTGLAVFKGREAKLNRAILQSLALSGSQTIYDLHKNVIARRGLRHIHYGNVNKRVRSLEQLGYARAFRTRCTKAGFEANVYELTFKAYLVMILDFKDIETLLNLMDDNSASEILAILVQIL